MSSIFTYDNYFTPYVNKFAKVTLDTDRRTKLATVIGNRIKEREKSKGRKLFEQEITIYRKTYMQTAGDLVLEQHLGLYNIVDYDKIFDDNRISFLNQAVPKKNIDVVTFNYGLFPMVYKKTYRKSIFICMLSKTDFYICGVGTPNIIDMYSRSDLLVSDYYKARGKSGFYGFERLTPISSDLGDFIELIS
jgi:hypothetical protein